MSPPGFTIRPDEILEQMKQLPNTRADRERGPPAVAAYRRGADL